MYSSLKTCCLMLEVLQIKVFESYKNSILSPKIDEACTLGWIVACKSIEACQPSCCPVNASESSREPRQQRKDTAFKTFRPTVFVS